MDTLRQQNHPTHEPGDVAERVAAESAIKSCSRQKVSRTVANLTPLQLARKRASDREAQRLIRARAREYRQRVEYLEQELEILRTYSNNKTIQELICHNMALKSELDNLKRSMGMSVFSSSFSGPLHMTLDIMYPHDYVTQDLRMGATGFALENHSLNLDQNLTIQGRAPSVYHGNLVTANHTDHNTNVSPLSSGSSVSFDLCL